MLRGFSTGHMPDNWSRIKDIQSKTLLITGELDEKFTSLNKKAAQIFPNAHHKIIPESGHNTHLEKPEEFFILVQEFLENV